LYLPGEHDCSTVARELAEFQEDFMGVFKGFCAMWDVLNHLYSKARVVEYQHEKDFGTRGACLGAAHALASDGSPGL